MGAPQHIKTYYPGFGVEQNNVEDTFDPGFGVKETFDPGFGVEETFDPDFGVEESGAFN
jgi:hypothetical protein